MEKTYSGPERRRHTRIKASFIVIYRVRKPIEVIMVIGNKEISALMLDLSEAGMAFQTTYDIPESSELLMRFTFINPYARGDKHIKTMEIIGEVRNNRMVDSRERRIGIYFTHISDEDKEAIKNFVKMAFSR